MNKPATNGELPGIVPGGDPLDMPPMPAFLRRGPKEPANLAEIIEATVKAEVPLQKAGKPDKKAHPTEEESLATMRKLIAKRDAQYKAHVAPLDLMIEEIRENLMQRIEKM